VADGGEGGVVRGSSKWRTAEGPARSLKPSDQGPLDPTGKQTGAAELLGLIKERPPPGGAHWWSIKFTPDREGWRSRRSARHVQANTRHDVCWPQEPGRWRGQQLHAEG